MRRRPCSRTTTLSRRSSCSTTAGRRFRPPPPPTETARSVRLAVLLVYLECERAGGNHKRATACACPLMPHESGAHRPDIGTSLFQVLCGVARRSLSGHDGVLRPSAQACPMQSHATQCLSSTPPIAISKSWSTLSLGAPRGGAGGSGTGDAVAGGGRARRPRQPGRARAAGPREARCHLPVRARVGVGRMRRLLPTALLTTGMLV